jgi:hypothetical protein
MVRMKPSAVSTRINTFDLLRGWCLIVISSDHLLRFPSMFDLVTGRGLMWVTAAEGFFFISGLLVGIVRGRSMHKHGLRKATHELWRRAGKLYLASVILTLGFTLISYALEAHGVTDIKGGVAHYGSVIELIGNTLTLQYVYGWTDFLNYYVVFMLISPAALWLVARRKWWIVLSVSLVLWIGKSFGFVPIDSAYLTWQSYFFFGLVGGYHYRDIHAAYRRLPDHARRVLQYTVITAAALILLVSFAFTFGTPFFEHRGPALVGLFNWLHLPAPAAWYVFFRDAKDSPLFTLLFQNNRTGLLRLPIFLVCFSALFFLTRRFEATLMRWLGWLLLPLGRNSLYVYIIQGVVVFAVALLNIPQHYLINSLITLGAVGLYWIAVRQQFLFKVIPR